MRVDSGITLRSLGLVALATVLLPATSIAGQPPQVCPTSLCDVSALPFDFEGKAACAQALTGGEQTCLEMHFNKSSFPDSCYTTAWGPQCVTIYRRSCEALCGQGLLFGSTFGGDLYLLDLSGVGVPKPLGITPTGCFGGKGATEGFMGPVEMQYSEVDGGAFAQSFNSCGQRFELDTGNTTGPDVDNFPLTAMEAIGDSWYATTETDQLEGIGADQTLVTFNPDTGVPSPIGISGTGFANFSGLSWERSTATLLGTADPPGKFLLPFGSALVTVDITTGIATEGPPTDIQIDASELGPDGRLYAAGIPARDALEGGGSSSLWVIDRDSGEGSPFPGGSGTDALGALAHRRHRWIFGDDFESGDDSTWPPRCRHDECTTGEPLLARCTDCTEAVCAARPGCCQLEWTPLCTCLANVLCDAPEGGIGFCGQPQVLCLDL